MSRKIPGNDHGFDFLPKSQVGIDCRYQLNIASFFRFDIYRIVGDTCNFESAFSFQIHSEIVEKDRSRNSLLR
jgi:hypothetical protein